MKTPVLGNPEVLSWLLPPPPDSRRLSPLQSEFWGAQHSSHSSCSGTGLQDFIWPGVDLFDGEPKVPSWIKSFLLLVLLCFLSLSLLVNIFASLCWFLHDISILSFNTLGSAIQLLVHH